MYKLQKDNKLEEVISSNAVEEWKRLHDGVAISPVGCQVSTGMLVESGFLQRVRTGLDHCQGHLQWEESDSVFQTRLVLHVERTCIARLLGSWISIP